MMHHGGSIKKTQAEEQVSTIGNNSPCPPHHLAPAAAAVTPVPPQKESLEYRQETIVHSKSRIRHMAEFVDFKKGAIKREKLGIRNENLLVLHEK